MTTIRQSRQAPSTITFAGALALAMAAGCGPGDQAEQQVGASTEMRGPAVVECWSHVVEPNQKRVTCGLVEGSPIAVSKATLRVSTSTSQFGLALTPEEPEQVILHQAGGSFPKLDIEASVTIDSSSIAGFEPSTTIETTAKLNDIGAHPADAPEALSLPFDLWNVAVVGKTASFSEALLAPYDVPGVGRIGAAALPAVALGDKKSIVVAAPRESLSGQGLFDDQRLDFSLVGSGAYFASPEGLTFSAKGDADTPVAVACWIDDANLLLCEPRAAGGLSVWSLDVTITGPLLDEPYSVQAYFDGDKTTLVRPDGYFELEVGTPLQIATMTEAKFPVTINAEVHLLGNSTGVQTGEDGTVLGFSDRDPFDAVPLAQSFTLESPLGAMIDAPLQVALPFDLWKITLRTPHASQFYAELAPYEVTFAQPYGDVAAGETMTVSDNLPLLSPPGVTEQFFFLPVDDQLATIAATTGETQAFSFDGPGIYEIGEDGVPHLVE